MTKQQTYKRILKKDIAKYLNTYLSHTNSYILYPEYYLKNGKWLGFDNSDRYLKTRRLVIGMSISWVGKIASITTFMDTSCIKHEKHDLTVHFQNWQKPTPEEDIMWELETGLKPIWWYIEQHRIKKRKII